MADSTPKEAAKPIDGMSAESWSTAAKYAGLIGAAPATFGSCIRALRSGVDKCKNGEGVKLEESSKYELKRLLRSESLLSPLYFAVTSMRPEKAPPGTALSGEDFISVLGPDALCSLLSILYFYRRSRKLSQCNVWDEFSKDMHNRMAMRARLGYTIPNLGPGLGILVGGLRHIAMSLFMAKDEKGFRAYRRVVSKDEKLCDLDQELKTWGCTHLQIATKVMQSCGFGLSYASGFCFGLSSATLPDSVNEEESYRWHITGLWLDSLRFQNCPPDITHKGKYYPLRADLDVLIDQIKTISSKDSPTLWLDKTKEELPDWMRRDKTAKKPTEIIVQDGAAGGDDAAAAEIEKELSL